MMHSSFFPLRFLIRWGGFFFASVLFYACSKGDGRTLTTVNPSITSFSPDSGNTGTQVTIFGNNFSTNPAGNLVKFNGIVADLVNATRDSLVVTVPKFATTGKITVRVNGYNTKSATEFVILSGTWTRDADYGGDARANASVFSIGSKAYVLGGRSAAGMETDLWEYDSTTGQWTRKADFPGGGRESMVAFRIGNKGYAGLGYNGTERNDFWEYDPSLDTWTARADFPGPAREGAVGFGFDTAGFAGMGTDATHTMQYNDCWRFSPAGNTWTSVTGFPGSAAWGASCGAADHLGYVIFGNSPGQGPVRECWVFDPSAGTWTRQTDFPGSGRIGGAAFVLGTKFYAGFGKDLTKAYADLWVYDPPSFSWSRVAGCPAGPRTNPAAFSLGNAGYLVTGFSDTGSMLKDLWQFTPE